MEKKTQDKPRANYFPYVFGKLFASYRLRDQLQVSAVMEALKMARQPINTLEKDGSASADNALRLFLWAMKRWPDFLPAYREALAQHKSAEDQARWLQEEDRVRQQEQAEQERANQALRENIRKEVELAYSEEISAQIELLKKTMEDTTKSEVASAVAVAEQKYMTEMLSAENRHKEDIDKVVSELNTAHQASMQKALEDLDKAYKEIELLKQQPKPKSWFQKLFRF